MVLWFGFGFGHPPLRGLVNWTPPSNGLDPGVSGHVAVDKAETAFGRTVDGHNPFAPPKETMVETLFPRYLQGNRLMSMGF